MVPTVGMAEIVYEVTVMRIVVQNELEEAIRKRRARECFPIINRGKLWYNRLSSEQVEELDKWYGSWLDAPETHIIPAEPEWLKDKLSMEEELW